jgi:hypothetical protein
MLAIIAAAFSVATGQTLEPGSDAVTLAGGWPGTSLTWQHGVSDRSDAGARVEVLYNGASVPGTAFTVGIGAAVPLRVGLASTAASWITLESAPGARTFISSPFNVFLRLPISLTFGGALSARGRIALRPELVFQHMLVNSQVSRGALEGMLYLALEVLSAGGLHFGAQIGAGGAFRLYPQPQEAAPGFAFGLFAISLFIGGEL